MSAAYIQVHFRIVFFHGTNHINPDQTVPFHWETLGYCFQFRLPMNIINR